MSMLVLVLMCVSEAAFVILDIYRAYCCPHGSDEVKCQISPTSHPLTLSRAAIPISLAPRYHCGYITTACPHNATELCIHQLIIHWLLVDFSRHHFNRWHVSVMWVVIGCICCLRRCSVHTLSPWVVIGCIFCLCRSSVHTPRLALQQLVSRSFCLWIDYLCLPWYGS